MPIPSDDELILDPAVMARLRTENPEPGEMGWLIDLYLREMPVYRQAVRDALANGDAQALSRAAHKFKGGSINFGASIVIGLCLQLERLAQQGNLGQAAGLCERLEAESERVRVALENEKHA